jgi:2-polyprenyl-3-methyl-5-hydroxy-6-metoxy-1,4-benzoquinol methylase
LRYVTRKFHFWAPLFFGGITRLYKNWIPQGSQVVDLGGRDGQLTRHFITRNMSLLLISMKLPIKNAKEKYDVETQLVNHNESLPFGDNSFDVVTMSEVLEHLQDRIRVITGSRLTMSKDPTHLQFMSYSDVKHLPGQYFKIEKIHILKGGKIVNIFPNLFARNVAFKCQPKNR